MSVSIGPGAMQLTRTDVSVSSFASAFVKAMTPPLAAE